jgi:sugar phosphate isomerase/epimerase
VFVACSTLCFSKLPLEAALRQIADLEFSKFELSLVEEGSQLRPSEAAENLDAALHRVRIGPSLTPSSLYLDFGPVDDALLKRRFEAMCRLAKSLTVAVLVMRASPLGTPITEETRRLATLTEYAHREGLVLTLITHGDTLTAEPEQALALCRAVPGLALTLDPSPYINAPGALRSYDDLFPLAQNMHLRDTGRKAGDFQVRVGQGQIEYGRVVNLLERVGYNRGLTIAILDELDNPFEVEVEVRKLKLLLESLL